MPFTSTSAQFLMSNKFTHKYSILTLRVCIINSTSSPSLSSSFVLASEKWKKISLTTSARSMKPKLSFIEHTTPWYLTGCAGFSRRTWHAPKLPLKCTTRIIKNSKLLVIYNEYVDSFCIFNYHILIPLGDFCTSWKKKINSIIPVIGSNLKAHFIPWPECDIPLNVIFGVW